MGTQQLDPAARAPRGLARGTMVGTPILPAEGPLVRRDLVTRELDGEFVLWDRRSQSAHRLNGTAAQVWSLCDGSRSTATIAETLAANGVDDAPAIVAQAIAQFERAGLLENPSNPRIASLRTGRRTFVRWGTAAVAASAVPLVISIAAPPAAHAQTIICPEPIVNCSSADEICEPFGNSSPCKCCNNPNTPRYGTCVPKDPGQALCNVPFPANALRPVATVRPNTATQASPTSQPLPTQRPNDSPTPSSSSAPSTAPSSAPSTRPSTAPTAAPNTAPSTAPSSGPAATLPPKTPQPVATPVRTPPPPPTPKPSP